MSISKCGDKSWKVTNRLEKLARECCSRRGEGESEGFCGGKPTSRGEHVTADAMWRERRGQLLRHVRDCGLAGGVGEAGRGAAVEATYARRGDHLATLRHVGDLIACGEEGQ